MKTRTEILQESLGKIKYFINSEISNKETMINVLNEIREVTWDKEIILNSGRVIREVYTLIVKYIKNEISYPKEQILNMITLLYYFTEPLHIAVDLVDFLDLETRKKVSEKLESVYLNQEEDLIEILAKRGNLLDNTETINTSIKHNLDNSNRIELNHTSYENI